MTDSPVARNYVVDFGNTLQPLPNTYSLGPNIQWWAAHGVRGVFQEGPGLIQGDVSHLRHNPPVPAGSRPHAYEALPAAFSRSHRDSDLALDLLQGSDLEELKDYIMGEMLWDPTNDPAVLIAEFLAGYYGTIGAPAVRSYLDTMHTAIANTSYAGYGVGANGLGMPPPAGVRKTYLTPRALLLSARAFRDGAESLGNVAGPKAAVYLARLERASMAILYPVMWRWAELKRFAVNESMAWPLHEDLQGTFDHFAAVFNATGTLVLTDRTQHLSAAQALGWLHVCVFAPPHKPGRAFGQDCCGSGQDQSLCRPGAPSPPPPPLKSCTAESGYDWNGTDVCQSNCAVSAENSGGAPRHSSL